MKSMLSLERRIAKLGNKPDSNESLIIERVFVGLGVFREDRNLKQTLFPVVHRAGRLNIF